jgi:hypothetical protein
MSTPASFSCLGANAVPYHRYLSGKTRLRARWVRGCPGPRQRFCEFAPFRFVPFFGARCVSATAFRPDTPAFKRSFRATACSRSHSRGRHHTPQCVHPRNACTHCCCGAATTGPSRKVCRCGPATRASHPSKSDPVPCVFRESHAKCKATRNFQGTRKSSTCESAQSPGVQAAPTIPGPLSPRGRDSLRTPHSVAALKLHPESSMCRAPWRLSFTSIRLSCTRANHVHSATFPG